jgi:hypothetical protein
MKASPIIGAAFICAAVALAPRGFATPEDDNFLALLDSAGIPAYDGIPSVIAAGHQVCADLGSGESPAEIADKLAEAAYADAPVNPLDQYQRSMVLFVQVSTRAFCPGQAGRA